MDEEDKKKEGKKQKFTYNFTPDDLYKFLVWADDVQGVGCWHWGRFKDAVYSEDADKMKDFFIKTDSIAMKFKQYLLEDVEQKEPAPKPKYKKPRKDSK